MFASAQANKIVCINFLHRTHVILRKLAKEANRSSVEHEKTGYTNNKCHTKICLNFEFHNSPISLYVLMLDSIIIPFRSGSMFNKKK